MIKGYNNEYVILQMGAIRKINTTKIITILFLFAVIFIQIFFTDISLAAKKEKYMVGVKPHHFESSPAAALEGSLPFVEYMEKRLGIKGGIKIYENINPMVSDFKAKTLDLGSANNVDYIQIKKQIPVTPIAIMVKGGSCQYRAILLVRKDSGINTLADLKGKKLAYDTKNSAHGYLYPKLLIKTKFKQPIEKFFGPMIQTPKEPDSILAVYYKKADVVSASDTTYGVYCELKPQLKRDLKIIETSEPFLHGPMFYYNDNKPDQDYLDRFNKELFNMQNDPEGNQILMMFKVGGWKPAKDSDYDSLRRLME